MKRLTLLAWCLLSSCSLEVPSSGPASTSQDFDDVEVSNPISVASGVGNGFAVPGSGFAAGSDAGVIHVTVAAVDGGAFSDAALSSAPGSDAGVKLAPVIPPAAANGFTLRSPAFDDGARLPSAFTCQGADQSPPLMWLNPPAETRSFALVMTSRSAARASASPDVEWVVWNIPRTSSELPQGVASGSEPSNVPGARQDSSSEGLGSSFGGTFGLGAGIPPGGGVNVPGFGATPGFGSPTVDLSRPPRYHGPCGVDGALTYELTLFALDAAASSQWGSFVSVQTVTQWLKTRSNVLAQASLSATYP